MNYTVKNMLPEHGPEVMAVLNYYVSNSMAAYFDAPLGDEYFNLLYSQGKDLAALVACDDNDKIVGLAFVRPMHPAPVFKRSGEWSIFLLPECTGHNVGPRLLSEAIKQIKAKGVDNLVGNVSSFNQGSIRFHERHGFQYRGRLYKVGRKFEQDFDLLYYQLPFAD